MRILFLARHYPPAVSGGARRPFLLANALRARGCEVFVVAPSLPDGEMGRAVPHPNRDPSTAPAGKPTLRDIARELLLWPDPDIRWSRRVADAARAIPADWVITTSPPESLHAAGLAVKRATGARWLADFRDHWLDRPHRTARAATHRRIGERFLARAWLKRADAVTCVDRFIAAELEGYGAHAPVVLPHFMPPEAAEKVSLPEETLNVVHTGSIALSDPAADIHELLAAFAAARALNPRLALHLVGRLTDEETAAARGIAGVFLHGVQPYAMALGYQRAADALIYLGSSKTRVPPSKIVEYFAAQAPIVAVGSGDWRADPRVDTADPVDVLANLRRGQRRAMDALEPTLNDAAEALFAILRR
jgi:glycosyltransferase involved in cell wall biosynthesis